jgi:hypothetical protein
VDQTALNKYAKAFPSRFKLVEFEYSTPYDWPEMDTLRYEICGCISFGLNQAAITLTNHLLESLLKYSLVYRHSLNPSKPLGAEYQLVKLMMHFTKEGLKKYGKATLDQNINEANKLGLINDEESELLHLFRKKFRNPFGHSDKNGIFGDLSVPVSVSTIQDSELISQPEVVMKIEDMPIFHGLAQAQLAEIDAPEYFRKMDRLVRKIKTRVFPSNK